MNVVSSIDKNDFSAVTIEQGSLQFLIQDRLQRYKNVTQDKLLSYGVNLTVEKVYLTINDSQLEEE